MTTLALIAAEYRDSLSKLADLDLPPEVVADTLESLQGDLELKAQNVALFVRSLEADAASIKQWAAQATERAKALDNRADSLREYLARELAASGIQKVSGPGIAIGWRKSSAVVIDEPGLVPAEFWERPPAPEPYPAKKRIADAIKAGQDVPGAHLDHRSNLQIK